MKVYVWTLAFLLIVYMGFSEVDARYYDICELTPEAGDPDRICRTLYFKWFYNIASKKCEQFIYGGCGGNENRFDIKDECDKRCVPGW